MNMFILCVPVSNFAGEQCPSAMGFMESEAVKESAVFSSAMVSARGRGAGARDQRDLQGNVYDLRVTGVRGIHRGMKWGYGIHYRY